MNIRELYKFRSKLASSTFQAHAQGLDGHENHLIIKDRMIRDEHMLVLGDYRNVLFPVLFKQAYGHKLCDIIDTGTASLYVISDKMKKMFEENNFTGWQTFQVKIVDKQGNVIEGYHGLSVTGRCGPVDYSKCEIIEKRLVPEGPLGKYYKGLYVGLDKWDGSDFFLPEKYYGTIVTERVAEIIQRHGATNVEFTNLMDIEIPDFGLPKT